MCDDSHVLRKVFALRFLLRKRDAQNDLRLMLEIWTGLRCLSLSSWFDRRVTRDFMQQLVNEKSRPKIISSQSGFVSESIVLLYEDLLLKKITNVTRSKTWFVNEFLSLASPNKIPHISKLLVIKYAELVDSSSSSSMMCSAIKDKYLFTNSSSLTWSAALSVLLLRHSSTRSEHFQTFVDTLAKSRWPECNTDSSTKLIVDALLPNERISRT